MIKHYQTKWGKNKGNCFQYAVASILELNPDDVPDFCNLYQDDWHEQFVKWLNQFGLSSVSIQINNTDVDYCFKDCLLLMCVENDDGVNHAAIYKNKELTHDPNFWYDGKYKVKNIDFIFPMNPAACIDNTGKQIREN